MVQPANRLIMKSYRIIVCFLVLMTSFAWSQQRQIDSLERLLKVHRKADTARATLLNARAVYYGYIDPEKSLVMADETIALAEKLKSAEHLVRGHNCKGVAYRRLGKDSLAMSHHRKAIDIAKKAGDENLQLISMEQIAIIYVNQGQYQKAIDLRRKELEMAKKLKDADKVAVVLSNLGVTAFYLADYPKAADYYMKALRHAEQQGDKAGQANALQNIGLVYKNMDKFERSLKYYREAEKIFNEIDHPEGLSYLWGNIGALYDQNGKPHTAIRYYRKAIEMSEKINDTRSKASHLANLGIAYARLKDYESAALNLLAAKKIYDEVPNINARSVVLTELGRVLLECPERQLTIPGINANRKNDVARENVLEALKLQREIGAVDKQVESHLLLSQIYETEKRFDKALEHYKQYRTLDDSIRSAEKKEEVVRREMQLESDRKEALARAEIKRQKIIKVGAFGGSGVLVLGGLTLFVGYRKRQKKRQLAADLLLRTKLTDAEMKALRLQLNPHFIFNSLNSISDYISKNDARTADHYLAKFAKLMRGILENSEQREIPLDSELNMLTLYLDLEAARLRHKFTYEIRISPDIDPEKIMVPPLILQPFVENCIWHGLKDKDGTGKILIDINRDNSILHCAIEDDGVGRKMKTEPSATSYGYRITKERIELLNKLKKTNASVNLIDLEQGTRVEVELPIPKNYESDYYR